MAGTKDCDEDVEYILIGAGKCWCLILGHDLLYCLSGLPRTGTMSTFTALEKILPGKCHHMVRAFSDKNDPQFWNKASRGQMTDEDMMQFIKTSKLAASVDFPMSLYWKDLARLYPNAKVLLNVRDPVKWFQSVRNTILQIVMLTQTSWLGLPFRLMRLDAPISPAKFTCFAPTYLGPKYPQGMFGAVLEGEETAVRFFNDWVDQVKSEIPQERLLVFEVKNGWEPLCKFLDVPVPDEPFPNVNDTVSMQAKLRSMKRFCGVAWTVMIGVVGTAAYYFKDLIISF